MKCSNCGGEKFIKISLDALASDGYWIIDDVDAYACENCRHVEFYVKPKVLEMYQRALEAANKPLTKEQEAKRHLFELQEEYNFLKRISEDRDTPPETVLKALHRMQEIDDELNGREKKEIVLKF